jgi:hypothetical protein
MSIQLIVEKSNVVDHRLFAKPASVMDSGPPQCGSRHSESTLNLGAPRKSEVAGIYPPAQMLIAAMS